MEVVQSAFIDMVDEIESQLPCNLNTYACYTLLFAGDSAERYWVWGIACEHFLIDIYAYTYYAVLHHAVAYGAFGKCSADFIVVPIYVVGPLDGYAVGVFGQRVSYGQCGSLEYDVLSVGWQSLGTDSYAAQQVLATLALPSVVALPSARRLIFGSDYCHEMLVVRHFLTHVAYGGIGLFEWFVGVGLLHFSFSLEGSCKKSMAVTAGLIWDECVLDVIDAATGVGCSAYGYDVET